MELNVSQLYEIEQLLYKGKKIEAIKAYREFSSKDLAQSRAAVEDILQQLKKTKPWMFEKAETAEESKVTPEIRQIAGIGKKAILIFVVFDFIFFAGLIYWFFLHEANIATEKQLPGQQHALTSVQTANKTVQMQQPVENPLPKVETEQAPVKLSSASAGNISLAAVDKTFFQADFSSTDSFTSLYQQKLNDASYIKRKNHSALSRKHDDSLLERKIKSLRRALSGKRKLPQSVTALTIPVLTKAVNVDGKITQQEWQKSLSVNISEQFDTTLYFLSDGAWLYIACDARDETTADGFDQLRVYLHAGLLPDLKNERVHLGKSDGVTSIRQTDVYWPGETSDNKNERWKKYAISDWGLYKYAIGKSALHGNRHYEMAIHLEESGLHPNVPFTLHAEIETDPLRNETGKFVKRRYLGELGNQQQPLWFVIK